MALRLVVICSLFVSVALTDETTAAERRFGVLARAKGALAFAPCVGESATAIDATTTGSLSEAIDWLLEGYDGAIRIEADAVFESGQWRFSHLRRAGHLEPVCPNPEALDYVWSADGEGGWRLLATPRSIRVSGIDGLEHRRFEFSPFKRGADGHYRYATGIGGEKLEIELAPDSCRSLDASGQPSAISDYRVILSWRGRRWTGCAHNGPRPSVDGALQAAPSLGIG